MPPALPSFPTRRSSDLMTVNGTVRVAVFLPVWSVALRVSLNWPARRSGRSKRSGTKVASAGMFLNSVVSGLPTGWPWASATEDRKSTRLNSSHVSISYAPSSTLFPYTTLFRSHDGQRHGQGRRLLARLVGGLEGQLELAGAQERQVEAERHEGRVGGDVLELGGERLAHRLALGVGDGRSEEHTSELQSRFDLVCPQLYPLSLHDALPIS